MPKAYIIARQCDIISKIYHPFHKERISLKKVTFVGRQKWLFSWWERVDSNHRSRRQQIYSLPPLATREHSHIKFITRFKSDYKNSGAGGRTWTPDLLITNQLLYQLSYTSKPKCQNNIPQISVLVKYKIEFFLIFFKKIPFFRKMTDFKDFSIKNRVPFLI